MTPKQKETFQTIGPCVTRLLFDVAQMHYMHFLTTKNHHHVVIGELYEEFEEELDELAEQFLGTFVGQATTKQMLMSDMMTKQSFQFKAISEEKEILQYLSELESRLTKGLDFIYNKSDLRFMQDTLSDLIAIVKSAKFQIAQK